MRSAPDPFSLRYMLRRTLSPWKFEACIAEAADYCRRYGIDEVIWKIDTEEMSHGLPTLKLIRTYLPALAASRDTLARAGVSMSINPWVTQGMRDAGWDLRKVFPEMGWLTDITGITAKGQGCPLSKGWRDWFFAAYEMYASTHPRVLWVEDDFRVIRHRPVYYSCWCERHLAEFSRRVGREWTRETLAAEILRPGDPSPVRAQWLDFLGAVMAEVLEELSARVQAVDRAVRLGLMTSSPVMHATEIRDWDRCMKAIAGPHRFVTIRPGMGIYTEWSPRDIYDSHVFVASTLACIRRPVHACGEIENWPFSRFSKSVRMTRAQVLLSAALRCPSMTFNLYDHVGTPLMEEPQYGAMLREIRPRVDALVEGYAGKGRERGVGMLQHEQGAKFTRLRAGATFGDLSPGGEHWARVLPQLGLTVTWDESPVVAVSGHKIRCFSDKLDGIFAGGVLLDLTALETLVDMGRADLAGVRLAGTFWRKERETPVEEILDAEFGAKDECNYMTVDHLGLEARVGELEPLPGARVISRFVNADRKGVGNAFILFENRLGGRVAVCPYDLTVGDKTWLLNWHRKRQMTAVAEWLFRGKLPLSVSGGAHALPLRTDYPGRVMVSVLNASLDAWPAVEAVVRLARRAKRVSRLDAKGRWVRLGLKEFRQEGATLRITSRKALEPLELATFRIVL